MISPFAQINRTAVLGPWCTIGEEVAIDSGVVLERNVEIASKTIVGSDTRIGAFSIIGGRPQDRIDPEGHTAVTIVGRCNRIHEFVTINRGTKHGKGKTVVGDENLIMSYCHIGHDSVVGNQCQLASYCALGGHCSLEDNVVVGAQSGINQQVRLGKMSYIAARTGIIRDVPPFVVVEGVGRPARIRGLNIYALRKKGIHREIIQELRAALKVWQNTELSTQQALASIKKIEKGSRYLEIFKSFVLAPSLRGVMRR